MKLLAAPNRTDTSVRRWPTPGAELQTTDDFSSYILARLQYTLHDNQTDLSLVDSKGYHRRLTELKQRVRPTACAALLIAYPTQKSGTDIQHRVKLDLKQFN